MDNRDVRARDIEAAIGSALLREWDPIGVRGIYRLLANGATTRELAEHLADIERDSVGLTTSAATLIGVAEQLKRININVVPS